MAFSSSRCLALSAFFSSLDMLASARARCRALPVGRFVSVRTEEAAARTGFIEEAPRLLAPPSRSVV